MKRPALAARLGAALVLIAACQDQGPAVPATVAVSPAAVTLTAMGDRQVLSATVKDQRGGPVAGQAITWQSADPAVATVSAAGEVTAVGAGTTRVTASSGSLSGSATVTVQLEVTALSLNRTSATLSVLGDTTVLVATARDRKGATVANAAFTWASAEPHIATVSPKGVVRAVANGTATITVSHGTLAATARVTVNQQVISVAVTAPRTTLGFVGDTVTLTAIPRTLEGRTAAGVDVEWSSANPAIATVSATGLVRAVANGSAIITARAAGINGRLTVQVAQVATQLTLSTGSVTFSAFGDTLRLVASAFDAGGRRIEGPDIRWAAQGAAAGVSATGLLTALIDGTTIVTATVGSLVQSATVVVKQLPARVILTPASVAFTALRDSRQLSERVEDARGNRMFVPVVWSSAAPATASVSSVGMVTSLANGATVVTAAVGQATGTASITVDQQPATVTVTPSNPSIRIGQTVLLTAVVADAKNNVIANAPVTWTSLTNFATVTPTGLVTGTGNGSAVISVTSGGATRTVTVNVTQF